MVGVRTWCRTDGGAPVGRSWARARCGDAAGQVVPFVALAVLVVLVVGILVVRIGGLVDRRARAQTAADAAALAGAREGPDAARSMAGSNGAGLESFVVVGGEVEVVVRVGDVRATARARRSW